MASPFSFFRKYQTWFYVVLGVFLMFAFVIADPLMVLLGIGGQGGRRAANAGTDVVVVRWRGGELTGTQLQRRMVAEYSVQELLQELERVANQQGGMSRTNRIPMVRDEGELMLRILLAEKARQAGMMLSDEAVYDYLDLVSDRAYKSREAYDALIQRLAKGRSGRGSGVGATSSDILEQLRTDLLAERYRIIALGGLLSPSLAELWELHQKLRREIVCDILPFPRADFVDQVGKPSAEGKNRYPDPDSPDPGFMIRRKARFGYFVAEFDRFVDEEMQKIRASITDEEIKKYYETNQREFRELDLPPASDDSEKDGKEKKPAGKESGGRGNDAKKPGDQSSEKPAGESPAEKKSPDETTADKKASEKTSADKKTPEKPSAGAEKKGDAQRDGDKKQSRAGVLPDSFPVTFQSETPQAKKKKVSPTEPPESEKKVESKSNKSNKSNPSETQKSAPVKSAEKKTTTEAKDGAKPKQEGAKEAPKDAAGDAAKKKEGESPKPIRYKPLDAKLKEEIRDKIARDRARPIAGRRLRRAVSAVRRSITEYNRAVGLAERRKKPAPAAPDFKALAEKHGLAYQATPLADILEVRRLSQADVTDESPGVDLFRVREFRIAQRLIQISFLDIANDVLNGPMADISPYRPEIISEGPSLSSDVRFTPSRVFVYWVSQIEKERVPKFDEVQSVVAEAWKQQEAFELARKAADGLAKQVESAGKPLVEVVDEKQKAKVVTTLPFTWLTQGPAGAGGQVRISSVVGTTPDTKSITFDRLGNDFMETAFGLKPNHVASTHDFPHREAYVIQHKREVKSEEQIRDLFLVTDVHQRLVQLTVPDRSRLIQQWYEELAKEFELKWVAPPPES